MESVVRPNRLRLCQEAVHHLGRDQASLSVCSMCHTFPGLSFVVVLASLSHHSSGLNKALISPYTDTSPIPDERQKSYIFPRLLFSDSTLPREQQLAHPDSLLGQQHLLSQQIWTGMLACQCKYGFQMCLLLLCLGAQLTFSFFFNPGPQGYIFLAQHNLETHSQTFPEVYFLDDSRSCSSDNKY